MEWLSKTIAGFFRQMRVARIRRRREAARRAAKERQEYWRALAGLGAPPKPQFTEGIKSRRGGS